MSEGQRPSASSLSLFFLNKTHPSIVHVKLYPQTETTEQASVTVCVLGVSKAHQNNQRTRFCLTDQQLKQQTTNIPIQIVQPQTRWNGHCLKQIYTRAHTHTHTSPDNVVRNRFAQNSKQTHTHTQRTKHKNMQRRSQIAHLFSSEETRQT